MPPVSQIQSKVPLPFCEHRKEQIRCWYSEVKSGCCPTSHKASRTLQTCVSTDAANPASKPPSSRLIAQVVRSKCNGNPERDGKCLGCQECPLTGLPCSGPDPKSNT